jgi:LacI family transcriptional regulator
VTASMKRNVYAQRHQGYADALSNAGIPYDKSLVLIKDLSEQCGIEAAMEILGMREKPDGAFITNDFSAVICMQTLKKQGIRIPEDIAIVGFNDDAISEIIEPKLTTIRYPGHDVGELAALNLINQLLGVTSQHQAKTIIVRSDLIVRQSSIRQPVC